MEVVGGYYELSYESESENCSFTSDSLLPHGLYSPWNSPDLSFLQGIFPTQGSNPGLLHCRWIVYQLSHMGSPIILEPNNTVPSAANLPDSRTELGSPTLQVDSLPTELSGKPELSYDDVLIFVFEDSICRHYFFFLPNFKNINTEVLKHKNLKALKK